MVLFFPPPCVSLPSLFFSVYPPCRTGFFFLDRSERLPFHTISFPRPIGFPSHIDEWLSFFHRIINRRTFHTSPFLVFRERLFFGDFPKSEPAMRPPPLFFIFFVFKDVCVLFSAGPTRRWALPADERSFFSLDSCPLSSRLPIIWLFFSYASGERVIFFSSSEVLPILPFVIEGNPSTSFLLREMLESAEVPSSPPDSPRPLESYSFVENHARSLFHS